MRWGKVVHFSIEHPRLVVAVGKERLPSMRDPLIHRLTTF